MNKKQQKKWMKILGVVTIAAIVIGMIAPLLSISR